MASSIETPSVEKKAEIWKARAQAKQKWLEKALAEKTTSPRQVARRMAWIKRALKVVQRAQTTIKYHTGLVDAYAQHLNALEMTLMSEADEKSAGQSHRFEGRETVVVNVDISIVGERVHSAALCAYGVAARPSG